MLSGGRRERENPLAINAPFRSIENFGFGKEEAKGLVSKERTVVRPSCLKGSSSQCPGMGADAPPGSSGAWGATLEAQASVELSQVCSLLS